MQANYPHKLPPTKWDTLNTEYRVRKFPGTGVSSETVGREWRPPSDVMKRLKNPVDEIKQYMNDYNVRRTSFQSMTTVDFGDKYPEGFRHNKHTSSSENQYIYPPSRKLQDRPPLTRVHGTTEMRQAYQPPTMSERLVTNKDQFKHSLSLPEPITEPCGHKDLEPLDTTYEGFEKLLDPYLTTSRLHHRPYTADQLSKLSNNNDVITYYTYADVPMIRRPKPETDWHLPMSTPKSMYDRSKFKQDCREVRTHNKLKWVPGSFRTEVRDNFTTTPYHVDPKVHHMEDFIRSRYQKSTGQLYVNLALEDLAISQGYTTETYHIGSGRPICSAVDQYAEKNKRLELICRR